MNVLAIISALFIGFVTAALGAIKDSPYEGFKPLTFFRSPAVALIFGSIAAFIFETTNFILLACFASVCERVSIETWKAIIGKKPGKFNWGKNRDRGWLLSLFRKLKL